MQKLDQAPSVESFINSTGKIDEVVAGKLSEALGDLPLALEHPGVYIETTAKYAS